MGSDWLLVTGASLPSGTDEDNLEEHRKKSCASAAKNICAVLAVHPRASELGTRQYILRGGSLPPGYSW
jgi:hypothetical protein